MVINRKLSVVHSLRSWVCRTLVGQGKSFVFKLIKSRILELVVLDFSAFSRSGHRLHEFDWFLRLLLFVIGQVDQVSWVTWRSCDSFSDTVPLLRLQTRRGVSTSPIINRKTNSTKTGGEVLGDRTRIRVKSTVGKPPSPRGRQVNSEEQWILMAKRFNVYVFFKEGYLSFVLLSTILRVVFCLVPNEYPCDFH